MADNFDITPGTGATAAADDIGGVYYPRIKLSCGADGSATDVQIGNGTAAASLRVTVASDSTGVLAVTDNSGSLTVDNGGTFAVQATSVVPGTGATNLGKAIDTALGATDTVVVAGTVRDDSLATLTEADGDVSVLRVTSVGRLYTSATIDAALPAGTNGIGKLTANSGVDIGDVDVTSISAGSNLIGDVALNGRATGSAISVVRFVSGASTNLTAVKASAGTLYGFSISNVKSSAVFVRFYNIASGSVTVGTSTTFAGPFIGPGATTGAAHTFTFPQGIPFSNAGWSVSITAGSLADNDTTATAASDCAITIFYV